MFYFRVKCVFIIDEFLLFLIIRLYPMFYRIILTDCFKNNNIYFKKNNQNVHRRCYWTEITYPLRNCMGKSEHFIRQNVFSEKEKTS